jgi:hypothetical protein
MAVFTPVCDIERLRVDRQNLHMKCITVLKSAGERTPAEPV